MLLSVVITINMEQTITRMAMSPITTVLFVMLVKKEFLVWSLSTSSFLIPLMLLSLKILAITQRLTILAGLTPGQFGRCITPIPGGI